MSFRKSFAALLVLLVPAGAAAQITPTHVFSPNTVISSSQVNTNFALLQNALNRSGGAITGNIAVSAGVTIDGIDISATLNQAVLTTSSPTFAGLSLTGNLAIATDKFTVAAATGNTLVAGSLEVTGALNANGAVDIAGGLTIGSGNVALVTAAGKITAISSTYFDSLDGTNLTGLAKLASNNTFTARNDFKTYSETKTSPTISAGALTIDLSAGTLFQVSLNANITSFTVSNPVPSGSHGAFTIKFVADGSVRTVSWPASFKWAGGSAPTMTGTVNRKDFVTCVYDDAGTTYNCSIVQNFPA